ncbi:beta-galactosidase [Bacteroidales bacterium]|nr:beta-galactosidase [Bacteroidales bacterium]
MRKVFILFIIGICASLQTQGQVSFGKPEKINQNWRFILEDLSEGSHLQCDDSRWAAVNLPHDWSVSHPLSPSLASATGYLPAGIAWYRKDLDISAAKKGEKVYVYFEGIYNRSEVYINGQLLGKRPNGYLSFMYDLSPYVKYGGKNVLAVRVDHSRSADSRWYTGSGIYRDAYLIYANPVHFAQWGVFCYTDKANKNEALLSLDVEVQNTSSERGVFSILTQLYAADGATLINQSTQKITLEAQSFGKNSQKIKIKNPKLWGLDSPYLYQLKTSLLKDGNAIDVTTQAVGVRTTTFDANKGFALNEEWMKVKGVCIHHDGGVLGSAVPREVWKRRLINLKKLGCNAIRMSHNPQAPDVYELCDELGMLVIDEAFDEWEFPKRKWLQGWNVGTPGFEGDFDFFEEWSDTDLADMIRRDRRHPSIIMWSIGNEVDYPNDPYSHPILDHAGINQPVQGGYKPESPSAERLGNIAKRLVAVAKKHDTSRPITAALAGVVMSNETQYPGALDVAGYNYTEDRYDQDHAKYPNRIIYGSENVHSMDAWKQVRDKEFVFGQFIWTGIDYLGESGAWPSRGFYSGLLDFGGFQKPRGYFRQALWDTKPTAYIGSYSNPNNSDYLSMDAWPIWNYKIGENIRVVAYVNTAKAGLFLNGKQVGETKSHDDKTGIIAWDIPFAPGKLEVQAFDKENVKQAQYAIQTSGRAHSIVLEVDSTSLNKDFALAQIVVQIVDEKGIPVMLSDEELTCHIQGPAKLLGLEASNNSDMSDYTDNVHRVFHGRMLAYVQSIGEVGKVKISFVAPWLKDGEIEIEIK